VNEGLLVGDNVMHFLTTRHITKQNCSNKD